MCVPLPKFSLVCSTVASSISVYESSTTRPRTNSVVSRPRRRAMSCSCELCNVCVQCSGCANTSTLQCRENIDTLHSDRTTTTRYLHVLYIGFFINQNTSSRTATQISNDVKSHFTSQQEIISSPLPPPDPSYLHPTSTFCTLDKLTQPHHTTPY